MLRALKAKSVLAAAVLAAFLLALFPALPARAGTVEDANQFLRETFALDFDYFKPKNQAGKALREIALSGEASEDWPMLAWGDAHGDKKTDSRGRTQYRYVGYSYFDEDVTNPFFPPDETAGGRLDQRNWIEKPWRDSRTEHLIYDSRFDTQTNPWLTERLRWGLYWAAKCNGFDPPSAASDLYRNPQKYVHVILPPAENTWGMGRMWHVTTSGKVWYVSVPLGPPEAAVKTPNFYVKSLDPGCPMDASGNYVAEAGKTYTATAVFGAKDLWPASSDKLLFPAIASVAAGHKVGGSWYAAELAGSSSQALAGARFAGAGASDVRLAQSGGARLLSRKFQGYQAVLFERDGAELRLSFRWTAESAPKTTLAAAINALFPEEGAALIRPVWWEGSSPPELGGPVTDEDIVRFLAAVQAVMEGSQSFVFDDNVAEVEIRVALPDFYVKVLDPGVLGRTIEKGARYTGTVVYGLKSTVSVPMQARLTVTHNREHYVLYATAEFRPGEEKSFDFTFTGQDPVSELEAWIRPVGYSDANWNDNVKKVVLLCEREPVSAEPGSLTFQAVSQTRSKTRPAGTAKWTDRVTATLKPPTPDPPRSDAWIEDWWIESASLTYPRKNPDFTVGCPYPPQGTRTVSMAVQSDRRTAKAEFQEDWALDGAPVYCLLDGRMMAEEPRQYTITASYRVGYVYAWVEWVTYCDGGCDDQGNCWTYCWQEPEIRTARGSASGTVSGRLLVNGTGVDSRAQ